VFHAPLWYLSVALDTSLQRHGERPVARLDQCEFGSAARGAPRWTTPTQGFAPKL
jgi:hypothetical protein